MDEQKHPESQDMQTESIWQQLEAAKPAEDLPPIPDAADAAAVETGAANEETLSPEAAFAEAMMADQRPAEDLPIEELPLAEKPVRSADPVKKEKKTTIIVLSIMGALLTCLLVFAIVFAVTRNAKKAAEADPAAVESGETSDVSANDERDEYSQVDMDEMMKYGSFTYNDESKAEEYNSKIIAKIGDHELTGSLLQVFYWVMVYNDLNENADYLSFRGPDVTQPFADQKYGQVVSWEQHYLQTALDYYLQNVALYEEAAKKGITLSEEAKQYLEQLPQNVAAQASDQGYASADEFLADNFGPGVTMDDYLEYYKLYAMSVTYVSEVQKGISATDEEVNDFYDAHAEEYAGQGIEKIDQNVVNVRHILITPETDTDSDGDGENDSSSDAAWAAAEQSIQEIYAEWQEDPTEDGFSALATARSADPGSTETGGLYEGIYPGQMVEEFNDWCFDPSRKPGDSGIVRTEYGYHLMYFVSEGDEPHWRTVAREECVYDKFNNAVREIFKQYEIHPDYENLHIFDAIARVNAKNAEAEAAAAEAGE